MRQRFAASIAAAGGLFRLTVHPTCLFSTPTQNEWSKFSLMSNASEFGKPESHSEPTFLTYSQYVERYRIQEFREVKRLIGELLVQFQNLEAMLRSGVGYFVNPEDDVYGAIVTEKLSFKYLTRAFLNLLEYHTAKHNIKIDWELAEGTINQCITCEEDRNRIMHAVYYPSEKGPMRYKENRRPGRAPSEPEPLSKPDLDALVKKTIATRIALSALFYWYLPQEKPEENGAGCVIVP